MFKMKGPTRPSSSALLLVASLFVCYHTGVETYHGKLLEKQNIILHRAVRTLLGFSESPQQDVLGDTRYQDAPKYMMDLYEKYKHSAIRKGRQRGNTVRSIPSDIGQVEGESMFIFNLSSILKSERVFNAEIHLYKKKMKTRMKRPRLKLVLYEIAPSYISEIGSLNINARGFGWQWYDVTSAVKSCMAARRRMPHLLAVKFSAERSSGKHSHVTLRKFMRQATSTPFLIVFSNDTQNITLDHIDPHFNAKELEALKAVEEQQIDHPSENDDDDDDDKDGDVDDEEDVEEPEKTSPTEMVHKAKSSQDGINSQELMTEENRERRSILDNEIPEHPHEIATPTKETTIYLPKTNPGILRGRHNQKNKGANSKLIPYPENSQRRRRRKKHRKNRRRNNKKELPFPGGGSWSSSAEEPEDNSAAVTDKDQLCGRRKLVVDFADVGWSEWIISPKSFEAHYCAGKCPFPLTKGMRPSNHATIQSIVHAIGIHADVPAPCCVPDVMGSVTLLYFDENRNVVLKNYPNMSVVSCACR